MTGKYDALLLVSFGGPEGMSEVEPFLQNVLRGRNVPPQRMKEVSHHYELFGGVSPINEQNRQLISAIKAELAAHGPNIPIYWGNRNWHPYLADAVTAMRDAGVKNALAFVTSAYSSYSGCRQYRENISAAQQEVENAPNIVKLRAFYNHPGFVQANVEHVLESIDQFTNKQDVHVLFTAHSIPTSMAQGCDYASQLSETAGLIAEAAGLVSFEVCYQSRSGPPTQPWLEPDVCDCIRACAQRGINNLVISPIGFVSDHMEVIYDLDNEAKHVCDELGIKMVRAKTAGTHPSFVSMIRELIDERENGVPRRFLGEQGARIDVCAENCCPAPAPR